MCKGLTRKNPGFECDQRRAFEPSVLALFYHRVELVLTECQLVQLIGVVVVEGAVDLRDLGLATETPRRRDPGSGLGSRSRGALLSLTIGAETQKEVSVSFYFRDTVNFVNSKVAKGGGAKGGPGHLHFSEQRKQMRFQQTHNQGLHQLFLTVS